MHCIAAGEGAGGWVLLNLTVDIRIDMVITRMLAGDMTRYADFIWVWLPISWCAPVRLNNLLSTFVLFSFCLELFFIFFITSDFECGSTTPSIAFNYIRTGGSCESPLHSKPRKHLLTLTWKGFNSDWPMKDIKMKVIFHQHLHYVLSFSSFCFHVDLFSNWALKHAPLQIQSKR